MRAAFVRTLVELAHQDSRIVLLTGDLGFMALEPFAETFPKRFFNVGVAEQNMVGVATGLAEAGFVPFVYSIVTFASLRPYEFIRNGPVLHRLPVRIVGVGGGFEYGHAGPTHHGLEDIAVMRTQPGITVIAPADHQQCRNAVATSWSLPGPVYYRLGKDDELVVPGLEGRYSPERVEMLREGRDIAILAMGSIAVEAGAAAVRLTDQGVSCAVGVVACVSPAPVDAIAELLSRHRVVITLEAHYVDGGLGSLVCEVAAERGLACRVVRRAVRTVSDGVCGGRAYLYRRHGLDRDAVVATALGLLGRPVAGGTGGSRRS